MKHVKSMKHVHTFESFLNEGEINEATTEFDFDPTKDSRGPIKVEVGEDFLYGRVVGKNYTYKNTKAPDVKLNVSRWKEGKAPNNYIAFLNVVGTFDEGKKIAASISTDFKQSGTVSNSNGTSSISFSIFDMSQRDLENVIKKFKTL
jgi:hypothetical protein